MILALVPIVLMLAQAAADVPAPEATPTPKPLPNGPVVMIDTSMGRIKIGLHKDKAPISVDNFTKYVRSGHYDGTIFHRVIPGFMAQGGGFLPDMTERPTRPPIRNEAKMTPRNLRGTLAMARTNNPDSATSQFFISVKDNPFLDFGIRGAGYAVFAEVLEGMDVVDRIVLVPTTTKGVNENVPDKPVMINCVREALADGSFPACSTAGAARPPARPAAAPVAKPVAPVAKPPATAPAAAAPAPKPSPRPSPKP
jgi:cyclophilin family peptidyl-prolyl cis-trans isomerase